MEQVLDYLRKLYCNNNREWFNANKAEYVKVHDHFNVFALQLLEGIRKFDKAIGPLTLNDITYRIYRDVRFSADKSPYKTHMGVYICPGGKKSGYSGYYFHVSAADNGGWESGHIAAAGDYICEPRVLNILREDIEAGDGDFRKILAKADPRFELDWDGALKKVPAGFPTDTPDSDFYRLKKFCLGFVPDDKFVTEPNLVDRLVELFRTAKPFLDYINRAISWSRENS